MKNGEVVQLKSGGPIMTIIDIVANIVTVTWFDHFNAIKEAKFPAEALKVVK
jgi:uncharacterized protein YodC (DUF2158 family)